MHNFTSFNLIRYLFWPRIWPIMVDISHALEKKVYYAVVMCGVFCKCYLGHIVSIALFRLFLPLQIFFLFVLSITEKGMLKLKTAFVDLLVSPFSAISFCFLYLEDQVLGEYTFRIVMSFW